MTGRRSPGPFRSRAQWRWAFATHREFARKWADRIVATRGRKTGFHSLPARKGLRKR